MTEAEWNACTDPQPMLEFLRGRASDRKLRLFAVACCRRIEHCSSDQRSQHGLAVAEGYSEGTATEEDRKAALAAADDAYSVDGPVNHVIVAALKYSNRFEGAAAYTADDVASSAACVAASASTDRTYGSPSWEAARVAERRAQAHLLRCLASSHFHLATIDPHLITAPVTSLAQAIYDDRAFDRMPILADALEDAGCTDPDILTHCRSGGEHVRGCWVVDLLTGKE